ncbi:unnamed protein product [Closterium sp. NIES-65]|nr:unnamed protein product [Closterium sp. NIES-65]
MPWVMLHLSTSSHPHFRALRFNHTPVEALSAAAGEKGQGSGGEGGGKVGGIVGGSGWGVRKGEVWRPRRGEGVCELGRGDWQMEREGYPLNGRTGFDYLHFAWRESECAHPFTLTHAPLSHPHLQPQENGRTDFDYLHFAWRESDCAHPFTRFRADRFFEAFQNRRIVFVGDSTLLSMFQSLLCLLSVGSDGLNAVELGSDRSGAAKPSSEGLGAVRVVRLDAWAAYVVAAQPHVLVIHTGGAWVGLQQRWQEHRARIHASQEGQKGQEGQEGQEGQSAANESKVFAAVAGKGVEGGMREEKVGAEGKVEVGGGKRKAGGGKGEPGGGKGEVGGENWKAGGGKGEPGGGKGEPGGGKRGGWLVGEKGKAGGGKGEPGGGTGGNGGGNKGTGEKAKGKGGGKKGNGGEKRGNGGEKKGSGGEKKGSGGENRGNGGENRGNGGENRGNGGENKGNGGGNRGNGGENRGNGGENKGNGRENRGNGGENKGNGGEKKGNGGGKKGNGGGKKGNGGGKKGNGGGKKGNSGGNGVDGWKNKGSGGGKQGNGGGYQGNGGGYQGNGGGNQGNGGGSKEAGQGNDGGNGGKGGGSKEVGQGNQGNGAGRKGNSVGDNKISAGSKGNGGMALGDNSKAGQKGGGTGKQAGSEMKKAGGKGESSGDKAKEKRKAVAEVQKTGKGQGKQGEGKRQKVGEKVEEGVMKQGGDNGGQTASGGGGGDTTSGSQTDPFAGGELRMGDFGDDDAILQGNMSILDGMDGADEAGSLGSMDGSDAAEGGSGEAVGGSKLEEGDVRLEEEEQQTGGSFMADEADIVLEEMSEASSSVGRGSFLDEDRPVENDEVPEQQQQQGGSVMADEADQVQEEMSQGRLSEGEVMPSVNQVTFDEEGEAAKEDAVQEKDNESHVVTGAENDKEVRGEDVHNEAANKEDESPGGPSVLPPNLLDSVDFLDPVAAFTKTLRMLHHFLSSQPTAESLPTFFLGLPREHYFRADQGNHTSLCLPDDVTCSGPMGRSRGAGEEDHAPSGGSRTLWAGGAGFASFLSTPHLPFFPLTLSSANPPNSHAPFSFPRPKRRRYATTSWQDAVGGGSSGGGGAGAGGEGAGAAAGGGGGGPGGGGGAGGTGGGARKGVYHCNYCHRDVTGEVRVKCAACVDFDLCAECFSVGAAAHTALCLPPDTMSFPLVHEDWTADEEMLLLEALEMYGMGNWGEIAEHVGSKSKTQCHDHYLYDYLLSPTGPLPDLSRLRTQADTEAAKAAMEEQEAAETAARAQEAVLFNVPVVKRCWCGAKHNEFDPEYDTQAEAPLCASSYLSPRSPPPLLPSSPPVLLLPSSPPLQARTQHQGGRHCLSANNSGFNAKHNEPDPGAKGDDAGAPITSGYNTKRNDLDPECDSGAEAPPLPEPSTKTDDTATPITSGYNTKRNEFDPEYDNEAEAPLAELEFKDSDSSVDRQLKIKMLHIYYSRCAWFVLRMSQRSTVAYSARLAELEFKQSDSSVDRQLKIKMLHIDYSRLEERSRRKAFILERGLLDPRRVDGTIRPESTSGSRGRVRDRDRTDEQHKREDGVEQGGEREGGTLGEVGAEAGEGGVEKGEGGGKRGGKRGGGGERRRSKEEREMFLRCRVFARFLSAEEHEGLVQSLTQAQRLRDRVAVLQEYEGLVQSLMQAQRMRDRVAVLQSRAAGAEWGWCRVGLVQSGAGAEWGWCRVGLVQSGAGAEWGWCRV